MAEPAVEFRDVCLTYRIADKGVVTLKEWIIRRLTTKIHWHDLHALSNVSFEVAEGKALGIVGPNGAGKSTLLRIAGGILAPSAGEAVIRGRLAPIIELGTGFEFELSGRENIFFNGAMLGRSRSEMQARFDEIVDFAGLGEFIDAPIRTYSTGMVARLAFAIATTVDARILLLDEILSVGDQDFRQKSVDRIRAFRKQGVTILFVSHDLNAVQALCDEGIWLDHGQVKAQGSAFDVTTQYWEHATRAMAIEGDDAGPRPTLAPNLSPEAALGDGQPEP
jgi:ABC-type polysaccharide/polyol phosphate transport system ATPase subunit